MFFRRIGTTHCIPSQCYVEESAMNCKEKLKILNHSIAVVVDQIEKLEVENKKLTAEKDRLAAEVARLTEARVVLITSDRGVCIGGRWDGWLMVRHPDGHWVSHHKLETVDPATEMTDLLRTAHAARREGEA